MLLLLSLLLLLLIYWSINFTHFHIKIHYHSTKIYLQAAWGNLVKQNTTLMIRHYEVGILFLPSLHPTPTTFLPSLPPAPPSLSSPCFPPPPHNNLNEIWEGGEGGGEVHQTVCFPLSFSFPPRLFSLLDEGDVPWVWDKPYKLPDIYGNYWLNEGR